MYRAVTLALLFVAGCSATMTVYDQDGNELDGVPVRTPLLVEITTVTEYQVSPSVDPDDPDYDTIAALCSPTTSVTTSFMPLGSLVYVGYKPAKLAKSEFKVDFGDAGILQSVSVNSDPAATTESVSSLLGTVLPFFRAPRENQPAAFVVQDLEDLRKKSCIQTATRVTSIREKQVDRNVTNANK